jgi:hypothetical protein
MERLLELGTWELVEPPKGANILGSKWVFDVKLKPDNTIERYKARLVVQGFGQKEGIDYDATFSNTAGIGTVRAFLVLVCLRNLHCHQMDVSTAFLYGEADKEIYMKQPPQFEDGTSRVCHLLKSLYGLKQAPRIWTELLSKVLISLGFVQSPVDPSLFILRKDGEVLYLLDFVDDMLLASHSMVLIDWVKQKLTEEFTMKDLGPAQKYVGIHIYHDRDAGEMWLHQASYCCDMAEKFGLEGRASPSTPLPSHFVLLHPWEQPGGPDPPEGTEVDPLLTPELHKRYMQIVGSLNYAAHTTRLDVAFAVSQLSRVCHCPRQRHLAAAERVVSYLAGTADYGLHFSRGEGQHLECFVDANYSNDTSKKSMTGFMLMVGGAPIYWQSRKQDRITTSTCDSESQAILTAVQYVEACRDVLEELGLIQTTPTPVLNDNSAAVKLSVDPVAHKRSIQLTRAMAYVRERTQLGIIAPAHVRTTEMPADFLTKRLDEASFVRCREQSGIHLLPGVVETL